MTILQDFGARLRDERKRLKMSQAQMASLGDLRANAQADYEKGARAPSADYLLKLMAAEVDVAYLFYGTHFDQNANERTRELLAVLVGLPPAHEAMIFGILNMFQLHAKAETVVSAEAIWEGVRLFTDFLGMDARGRSMVKLAVKGAMAIGKE